MVLCYGLVYRIAYIPVNNLLQPIERTGGKRVGRAIHMLAEQADRIYALAKKNKTSNAHVTRCALEQQWPTLNRSYYAVYLLAALPVMLLGTLNMAFLASRTGAFPETYMAGFLAVMGLVVLFPVVMRRRGLARCIWARLCGF